MQDKMYRIFVSSTYLDLKKERQTIIRSILQLGHFPICMETFVASQYHQMDFIKEQLDTADMFIIIVGKKYGSCPEGDTCSYTEHEYEYAKQIGLPILSLISSDKYHPNKKLIVETPEKKKNLQEFLNKLKREKLSAFWDNAADLACKANASIEKLIRKDVEGWIRETKFQRIKRKEITDRIYALQKTIYQIDFVRTPQYDCFVNVCNELVDIYQILQNIGFSYDTRVQFKKLDFLFYYIKSKTQEYNLNPVIFYKYAQFLNDFYEIEKAKEVINIYLNSVNTDIEKANAFNFMGLLNWKTKHFSQAIENLNNAKNLLLNPFASNEPKSIETIASYQKKDETEKSLKILCEVYNTLGLCADNKAEYYQAISLYNKAVTSVEKLNSLTHNTYKYKYQLYLFNLSSALFKTKQYNKAFELTLKVIQILEKELPNNLQNKKRLARSYQLYGDILFNNKNESKAKSAYFMAIDLYKYVIKRKDLRLQVFLNDYKKDIAWCCHKLSEVYYKLHQYDNAISILKKSIGYREELLLSSIGQEHFEYLVDIAESEFLLGKILFFQYNKNQKRHKIQLYESYRYADNAFYYFEQLFDTNHDIYRKSYKKITEFNIKLCIELNNLEKVNYFNEKLKLAA